jgi:hypothetical protein
MKKLATITIILILMQGIQYLSAQDWHLTGNTGTNASTNFIGTTDNEAFKIRTNNSVRLTINSSGKVGIGTTSPQDKFHVNGTGSLARFGTGTTATTYNYWYTGNDVGSFIEHSEFRVQKVAFTMITPSLLLTLTMDLRSHHLVQVTPMWALEIFHRVINYM